MNTVLFPWLGPTANYHMLKIGFLGISFLAISKPKTSIQVRSPSP